MMVFSVAMFMMYQINDLTLCNYIECSTNGVSIGNGQTKGSCAEGKFCVADGFCLGKFALKWS